MRRFSFMPALLVILGATAFLGAYSSGASSPPVSTSADQPFGNLSLDASPDLPYGNLSLDASPGDNAYNAVGTIASTASVTDGTCGDAGGITVDMVIGDSGTQDGVDETGGIPAGSDIGGWQARIQFNPSVLTFVGFQISDAASGNQFLMEKASTHATTNDHITVVFPSPAPGIGKFDIGSTVLSIPPGANRVGMIARLTFDCVAAGGTSIFISDSFNSFYSDVNSVNHSWAARNCASLLVNGGTAPDTDSDGWTDCHEAFIGTDPLLACGVDAWPADVTNDGFSDISDISLLAGNFGKAVPPAPRRQDVAPDPPDGFVDITDIAKLAGLFGQPCPGP